MDDIRNKIPKIIHYCWFGEKEKSDEVLKCIESWKKYLPDYSIIEWNERNFDINNSIEYVKEAYKHKKWAFVSDYVRIKALYNYGGLYFDTDVEVFKNFDCLLNNRAFFGFESKDYITTATMGVEKEHELIKAFISTYKDRHFVKDNGEFDLDTTNVVVLTKLLQEEYSLQLTGKKQFFTDLVVFPQFYFSSNDFINIFGKYRKKIFSYHHCQASWYRKVSNKRMDMIKHYFIGVARNTIGTDRLRKIKTGIKILRSKKLKGFIWIGFLV